MTASLPEAVGDAVRATRHLVLAAAVAGLLLGPRAPAGLVAVAALAGGLALSLAGARRGAAVAVTAAVALGAGVAVLRLHALGRTALGPDFGHVVRGEATILQAPRAQAYGGWSALARFRGEPLLLRMNDTEGFGAAAGPRAPDAGSATGAGAGTGPPRTGEIVRVRGALHVPDDYARALRAHAVMRAFAVTPTGRGRGGAAGMLDGLRRRAERALARGPDPVRTALLQGMVLGQDAGLPTATRDEIRAAGLSHLTAASGANVVLLATLVLAAAGLLGVPFHARWLLVLGVIALYVPLAGGGPSIQRAGVMGAAGVVAVLAGRPAARWYALFLAALLTLGADPRAAGDPGWQLSFAAVTALLLLGRPWATRLSRRGLPRPLAEALAVTAAATLATAPVIALRFGQVAPLSLPANLLVAPVVAPVMWLGAVAALIGGPVPAAAGLLDAIADPLLHWVLSVAHRAAAGPSARLPAGVVAALCLCAVAGIGAAQVPRLPRLPGRLGRRRMTAGLPAALTAALLLLGAWALRPPGPAPAPPVTGFRVSFLDVGQGDATLLQVPGHAVLVDTGPPGGAILIDLARAGVGRLDALVVTHAQADHEGGAAAVLARLPVGLVVDGRDGVPSPLGDRFAVAARARGVRSVPGRAGMVLHAGALAVRILSPGDGPTSAASGADPNQRAIVAEADADGGRVLLTADAESDVLAGLDLGPVDVLKVSHHGSADPGLPALLRTLHPLIAGIEVGARNTYGHPAPATLGALRAVPQTVRTDRDGTVRADLVAGRWTVTPERPRPSAATAPAGPRAGAPASARTRNLHGDARLEDRVPHPR